MVIITDNFTFTTRLKLKDSDIEVINNTELLETILTDDLKWDMNTAAAASTVKKANMRMELHCKKKSRRMSSSSRTATVRPVRSGFLSGLTVVQILPDSCPD